MPERNSSSRKQQLLRTQIVGVLFVLGFGLLIGMYLFADADPLGLFTEPTSPAAQTKETVKEAVVTQTKEPAKQAAATRTPALSSSDSAVSQWWQVYFTDPATINDPNKLAGSIPEKLIELIDRAQQTIHIASFEFNLTPVADALIAAHRRGVQVLWLTDDENGVDADDDEGHGQYALLLDAGIEVRYDDRTPLMHDKFWVFDNAIVWTGSTNITVNDNFRNNNNVIVLYSPDAAAIYERQFVEMWAGQLGPKSPSTIAGQALQIEDTKIQILFSPEDNVMSQLIPLVEQAKKSIRFMAFSYTHDGLEAAMEARAGAGVDVKGIFETRSSETEFSALRPLYCAKLPVRQDGNPGTFHHKVIVIDNKIVITGSLNFSANADEGNNENTLILYNTKIAKLYLDEFNRRWKEAVDPDPAKMNCRK